MKLAYLLSEYPTLGHTYILREVRRLRELGWDIQTISIRRPPQPTSPLSEADAEEAAATWYVLGSGWMSYLGSHAATFAGRPLRYLSALLAAVKRGKFHPRQTALSMAYFVEGICAGHRLKKAGITYVHSVYSTSVAMTVKRVFDVNLSMTLHGPAEFFDPEGFGVREKVHAADLVCSISNFGRSQIMLWSAAEDWHKLEVTPLGVDVASWPIAEFREDPSPFELITVGRLVEVKGYRLMLDAIAELRKQGRNVRLTLAGDGADRRHLEEQAQRLGIADCVVFAGWKNQEQLREMYLKSDACVMSSFAEGIPVVMMESMAAGVPCVAPSINGIPELIRNGVDGLLFAASDVQELAICIGRIMDDREMRRRMATSSREQVAAKFDLKKNVQRLSEVFRQWVTPANAPSGQRPEEPTHKSAAS